MHPGPPISALEITEEAAEDPRSVIRDQVHNGVAITDGCFVSAVGR